MKTKTEPPHFVRIRIGASDNSHHREWFLSRFQFELILITVPVFFIWGIVSTGILIRGLPATGIQGTNDFVATKDSAESADDSISQKSAKPAPAGQVVSTTAVPDAVSLSSSPSNFAPEAPATNVLVKASFTMSGAIKVNSKIYERSDNSDFRMSLDLKNLTDEKLKGKISIQVFALSLSGATLVFDAASIDAATTTFASGERFLSYSFTNVRSQVLVLAGKSAEVAKFVSLVVTLVQDGQTPTEEKVDFIN